MSKIWTPRLFALAHPTLFTPREIELYEKDILANSSATEHDASRFFARHPKFLFLGKGAAIRREVVISSSDGQTTQRVDFFRRSFGEAFWDIIELKAPQKSFVVAPKSGHPRPSSHVIQAVSQAEDYRDLIVSDEALRQRLLRLGIAVCRPQITVIVGQDADGVSDEVLAVLYDRLRRGPIKARTYTDIYRFAKEHCTRNNILFTGVMSLDLERVHSFGDPSLNALLTERGDATILSFGAGLRFDEDEMFRAFWNPLILLGIESSTSNFVVDFTDVDFLDRKLLGAFVILRDEIEARKARLTLAGLRPEIKEVITTTGLGEPFSLKESVDEAL